MTNKRKLQIRKELDKISPKILADIKRFSNKLLAKGVNAKTLSEIGL